MASTVLAATLTETHRVAQLILSSAIVGMMLRSWPQFDVDNLDESWTTLEPLFLALIAGGGDTSAGLSAAYYNEFRVAEAIEGAATPVLAAAMPVEETIRSLRFVGLVGTEKLVAAGRADAAAVAFTNLSGEVTRQVLNRGRETLVGSVDADRHALGWARVTDTSPCAFCRMLAGRGPVYSEAGGHFAAHGHCGCSLEPVYSQNQPWPGRSQEYHDEWHEVVGDLSGADARLAYRQHVEGRSN